MSSLFEILANIDDILSQKLAWHSFYLNSIKINVQLKL